MGEAVQVVGNPGQGLFHDLLGSSAEPTSATQPDRTGDVFSHGVRIHYQIFGDVADGRPTVLLLPSWTVVHARFWKMQIAYLSSRFRVITYDGPGNGASDRPLDSVAYGHDRQVGYALAVLDDTRTSAAVVVGLSQGAVWALQLAAQHADRVLATVTIGAAAPLTEGHSSRAAAGDPRALPPSAAPWLGADPSDHWAKYDPDYWEERYEDFLWFFFGQCFPEPRSSKAIEDCVRWGLETSPRVLTVEAGCAWPTQDTLTEWCRGIRTPVMAIHGDQDPISPVTRSERLVELTGGELVILEGSGHIPVARDPVRSNLLIADFVERTAGRQSRRRTWTRGRSRPKRVLYLSSPIGLGHARRDLAIAQELRLRHEDVQIDWLAQDPVTRVLAAAGESVHPASRWLASESAHIEWESGEHDLHAFEALRRMDEVLVGNFHVFEQVAREGDYDLVVADEGWEVDHFLHENPELKRFAYAWMTDFVGYLPMPDDDTRQRLVAADYNAEMIEHIERFPRVRDLAIFVGDPEDIVADRFGDGLPYIREWSEEHYDFCGYITGIDPTSICDRTALRQRYGWTPNDRVCLATVGGSAVGTHLLQRVSAAFDLARDLDPDLSMVVVTGPRIPAGTIGSRPGLSIHEFVPDLHLRLAAADLAVVQGGLTTTMELTAARRPFIYVPLRHHFEQNIHVAHRLDRYGAGRRMYFDELTAEALAEAIAVEIGRPTDYLEVASDGAARAASMLSALL